MEQEGASEPRQLKLRGVGEEKKGDKEGKEKKSESGSKLWVVAILGATIVVSLIFSAKNKAEKSSVPISRSETRVESNEVKESGGFNLFKPAEYEFGN